MHATLRRSQPQALFQEFDKLVFSGSTTAQQSICQQLGVNSYSDFKDLRDKKIYLRLDLNTDPNNPNFINLPRVVSSVQIIEYLINQGARVVITSHLSQKDYARKVNGSAKGQIVSTLVKNFSQLKGKLSFMGFSNKDLKDGFIDQEFYFARVSRRLSRLKQGSALFLENPRLLPHETQIDEYLSGLIQKKFDYLIHDGFSVGHRAEQFSTDNIFRLYPPNQKALGPNSCREWSGLFDFAKDAKPRSVALILGGDAGKFDDKLSHLADILRSDKIGILYLGGTFALAYLLSRSLKVGSTPIKVTPQEVDRLARILKSVRSKVKIIIPRQLRGLDADKKICSWRIEGKTKDLRITVPEGSVILDQMPFNPGKLLEKNAVTRVAIFGPLGYYLKPDFATGSTETFKRLLLWKDRNSDNQLMVGGGNTLEAISSCIENQGSTPGLFVSTGGGACMGAFAQVLRMQSGQQFSFPVLEALRLIPEGLPES